MLTARCRAALSPGWTGTAADLAKLIGVTNVQAVRARLHHLEKRGEVHRFGFTPPGPGPFDKGLRVWAASRESGPPPKRTGRPKTCQTPAGG